MRKELESALYSGEEFGVPPSEFCTLEDVEEALNWAMCVFDIVYMLFKE